MSDSRLPSSNGSDLYTEHPDHDLVEIWFSLSDQDRPRYFVNTKTAARRAAVSQRTIRLWIDCGNIRALRIGKKYHVYISSLKELLSKQTF